MQHSILPTCNAPPQGCGRKNVQADYYCKECEINLCADCTLGSIVSPRDPKNLIRFDDISCGGQHILANSREFGVYSWGKNDHG